MKKLLTAICFWIGIGSLSLVYAEAEECSAPIIKILTSARTCEDDSECVLIWFGCPFCTQAINAANLAKIETLEMSQEFKSCYGKFRCKCRNAAHLIAACKNSLCEAIEGSPNSRSHIADGRNSKAIKHCSEKITQNAISILEKDGSYSTERWAALQRLLECHDAKYISEVTLQRVGSTETEKEVTYEFPNLGLRVTYINERALSIAKAAQPVSSQKPTTLELRLIYIFEHEKPDYILVIGDSGFRTVESLKQFLGNQPKGTELKWAPSCERLGGEPLLSSESEMSEFRKFLEERGITFTLIPSG